MSEFTDIAKLEFKYAEGLSSYRKCRRKPVIWLAEEEFEKAIKTRDAMLYRNFVDKSISLHDNRRKPLISRN